MEKKRLSFIDEEKGEKLTRKTSFCESADNCVQRPIVIAIFIAVLIFVFGAGAWIFGGRLLQELENYVDVFEYFQYRHNGNLPSGRGFFGGLFPQVAAATTTTTTLTTTSSSKPLNTVRSQIDGYYFIGRENNATYIQKSCENCKKIRFNDTQQKEIASFLATCFFHQRCNTNNVTVTKGLCLVCDSVVHLKLSPFSFCVDFHGFLNAGLISSYILYSDLLHALYTHFDV